MNKVKNKRFEYGIGGYIQLVWFLLRTKLIDKRARIFRFPFTIRGRKYIDFGKKLTTGVGCRFECFPGSLPNNIAIRFGKNVQVNDYVHIVAMDRIEIGDNVLMASHVFISDNSHGAYKCNFEDSDPRTPPTEREYSTAPIKIGNNVWIGEGVCIMPGVTIGDGCVIGAHSVVSKSIPDYTIAVGAPARVVKKFDFNTKHWEKV
jgi:lipopolysaccharide O-acetyltransferase